MGNNRKELRWLGRLTQGRKAAEMEMSTSLALRSIAFSLLFSYSAAALATEPDDPDAHKVLIERGGSLYWGRDGRVWKAEFRGNEIGDAQMKHIQGLHSIDVLDLTGTDISDTGIACLREKQHLRVLYLGGTKLTDAGVAHLTTSPRCGISRLTAPRSPMPGWST